MGNDSKTDKFEHVAFVKDDNEDKTYCVASLADDFYTYVGMGVYLQEFTPFLVNAKRLMDEEENLLQIALRSPDGRGWLDMDIEQDGKNNYRVTLRDEDDGELVKSGNIVCLMYDGDDFIIRVWKKHCEEHEHLDESFDFMFEKELLDFNK